MSLADADLLFRRLDRELWLVTARHGERRGGLIATTVTSISIVPTAPRVLVGIAKQHATWELIEASSACLLQLLPLERFDVVERFGMHTGRECDKFAREVWCDDLAGGPRLECAVGWLDCRVEARFDTGDRTVYLAAVQDAAPPPKDAEILTQQVLLQMAPREWLPTLRAQLSADGERDRIAIDTWRAAQQQQQQQ